jgi:DNA-binding XRE family transcriptional regulator
MRKDKKKRLEAKGWRTGSAGDFLGLSAQEEVYIEIRLRLADGLKRRRLRRDVTQADLARTIHSSQSRIAKMEAGDPTVSIDLLVRTLLALGASERDVAGLISGGSSTRAA